MNFDSLPITLYFLKTDTSLDGAIMVDTGGADVDGRGTTSTTASFWTICGGRDAGLIIGGGVDVTAVTALEPPNTDCATCIVNF